MVYSSDLREENKNFSVDALLGYMAKQDADWLDPTIAKGR
jgi:hypothetical protein